jgi:hypothetical protein
LPTQAVVTEIPARRAISKTVSPVSHGIRAPAGRKVTDATIRP